MERLSSSTLEKYHNEDVSSNKLKNAPARQSYSAYGLSGFLLSCFSSTARWGAFGTLFQGQANGFPRVIALCQIMKRSTPPVRSVKGIQVNRNIQKSSAMTIRRFPGSKLKKLAPYTVYAARSVSYATTGRFGILTATKLPGIYTADKRVMRVMRLLSSSVFLARSRNSAVMLVSCFSIWYPSR